MGTGMKTVLGTFASLVQLTGYESSSAPNPNSLFVHNKVMAQALVPCCIWEAQSEFQDLAFNLAQSQLLQAFGKWNQQVGDLSMHLFQTKLK